jgi:thymidylate synthase (FAD)
MKIIKQSFEVITPMNGWAILDRIEECARVCYKSEGKKNADSAEQFVKELIYRGHEAMLEHTSTTVKVTTDRGVSHEIVRHRLASYAQESTRYCNYGNDKFNHEITVVEPVQFSLYDTNEREVQYSYWKRGCLEAEDAYMNMLKAGASAQEARAVLPHSLKTEIVITMNMREWRHFFKLRCSKGAHPQMRSMAISILDYFKTFIPVIFDDIEVEK